MLCPFPEPVFVDIRLRIVAVSTYMTWHVCLYQVLVRACLVFLMLHVEEASAFVAVGSNDKCYKRHETSTSVIPAHKRKTDFFVFLLSSPRPSLPSLRLGLG